MQIVNVADLESSLNSYIDPEQSVFPEECRVFAELLRQELDKITPQPTQVMFWDDQELGDPQLDLNSEDYDHEDLLDLTYNESGSSYYGMSVYNRKWLMEGLPIFSLWFGGSPLNSAPGFYVIPVPVPARPE